ncbi:MAG: 2,3-diphosphoglycerate-dependent phosphoglycerate mutase [Desulfohalobiaceae bacterium]
MSKLILLRHGQSVWNQENRFTGWMDVALSPKGEQEAREAGRMLARAGFGPGFCFVSYLKRAVKTLWLALEEMDLMWLPVSKTWRLNERHYGALQGMDKDFAANKYGHEQVQAWRRGYRQLPPGLEPGDANNPALDPRYAEVTNPPLAESLELTVRRVLPCWREQIAPVLNCGQDVLVCAHGNSLRGLVMHLRDIPEQEIPGFELPTGLPLVFRLDSQLRLQQSYFLQKD